MVIYCLTNRLNQKKYIGQTIDFRKRMYEHRSGRSPQCRHLFHAIKKYGWESFDPNIIDSADTKKELDALETQYIKKYDTMNSDLGYNLTTGGEGAVYSEESKKRISDLKLAWWDTHPEEKERVSKQHKGKKLSQETKDLMIKNMPQRKEVMIEGKNYVSIREAARQFGISKQLCMYRLKSDGFPEWRVLQ